MMASNNPRHEHRQRPSVVSRDPLRDLSEPEKAAERLRKHRRREANVYDAVAGRVTSTQPLDGSFSDSEATADVTTARARRGYRHHAAHKDRHRDAVLAPEEVLFRRLNAPVRFAEKDIYHAHESLPDGGRDVLPDSDLLKAVHSYASHFYDALATERRFGGPFSAAAAASSPFPPPGSPSRGEDGRPAPNTGRTNERGCGRRGNIDERSMDETALLAFGILLEEAGREGLGRRGDLVFTEGMEAEAKAEAEAEAQPVPGAGEQRKRREPRDDGAVFGALDGRRWDRWREQRLRPRRTQRGKDKGKGKNERKRGRRDG